MHHPLPAVRHLRLSMAGRRLLLLACLALGACASRPGHYYQDDGPPEHPPAGLAQLPDAMPRIEPLNLRANRPYQALGRSYSPDTSDAPFEQRGVASWYGRQYHGNPTASGEPYDMYAMSAAHPTLPIPSYARVTRVSDGRSVVVRINDRGPFLQDRIIDLSYAAAARLGIVGPGSAEVLVHKITARDIAAGSTGAGTPPVAAPAAVTVPVPQPAPVTVRAPAPVPVPAPVTAPVSVSAPVAAPTSVPVPGAAAVAASGTAPVPALASGPETAPAAGPATDPVNGPAAAQAPEQAGASVDAPTAGVRAPAAPADTPADTPAAKPADTPAAPAAVPTPPAAAKSDAPADTAGKWSVQLGAFAVRANAEALRDELTSLLAKPEADVLPADSRRPRIEFDGRVHHVVVGAFDARADAQRNARALQRVLSRDTTLYRR